jgi:hypothetical protein
MLSGGWEPQMGVAGQEDRDVGAIVSRIGALFERAHARPAPTASEIREALADGYACLVSLEADRARAARRSAELFASDGQSRSAARELRALNARLLAQDLDIARLRLVLGELRAGTTEREVAG